MNDRPFSATHDTEPPVAPDLDVSEAAMTRLRSPFQPRPAAPSPRIDGRDRSHN